MKSFKDRLDNENLITLVEEHPCLYNPFLKNYRNKKVRYLTWQKIAGILGVDSESCQKRWRTLRDRYKKEKSGTVLNKNNKSWEYASMMSFLDKMYQEHSDNLPRKKNLPVIQPFTSQPVIITVPKNRGLRPIAPKIEECTTSKSSMSPDVYDTNQDSVTENESEEQLPQEPEIYLVTPTLFNEGERTLFKNSLNTPKRKASHSIQDEETVVISSQAKRAAREEDTLLRRQEFEYRLQWDEKEHFLRVKCQEEEHKMKMKVEQAKLRVEEENLRIKEQKLKVLIAKEAYFKSLIKTSNAE